MAMTIGGMDVETVLLPLIVAAGGGVIDVPAGVHTGYFNMDASNVWFRGEDQAVSIMRFVGGVTIMVDSNTPRRRIRFSDICLDGNNQAGLACLVRAVGYGCDEWVFERCWFKNFVGTAVTMAQARNCRFIDCVFSNQGTAVGTAIQVLDATHDLDVVGCTFSWVNAALVSSGVGGDYWSERLRFIRNTLRQDWWGIKAYADANATGSGGTVSYSATVLTDTAKTFTNIPDDSLRTIRIMPVLRTGTTTNVSQTILEDGAATFLTYGTKYGDIIRTATAWTMVVETVPGATTKVVINGWKDLTTYEPVVGPTIGTAYTLYRTIVGRVAVRTATTIQTDRWHDLNGNTVTVIAPGTRYEVLGTRASAGVHLLENNRYALLAQNVFHGCWADQLTLRGEDCISQDNICVRGQDMGITNTGKRNRIAGGICAFNGVNGIYVGGTVDGTHNVIDGVTLHDNTCQANPAFTPNHGDIVVSNNDFGVVTRCIIRRGDSVNSNYGIIVTADAPPTGQQVRIQDNIIQGHTLAPVILANAHSTVRVRQL